MSMSDIGVWAGILGVIVAIIALWVGKKYRQKDHINCFPPKNKCWAKPYFRLSIKDDKSVKRFIDFINRVDNEIIEIDIVIDEDEAGLISVSRDKMENSNELSSDSFIIWEPYAALNNTSPNSSNSTGIQFDIIYTTESDAGLFFAHGCWYLKGFFTIKTGFTNHGICSIQLRAEKVQSRKL